MKLREQYDFENLTNETERYIFEELERQLEASEDILCICQDCVLDMAAFALNSVKPVYRVSLLGKVYAESLGEERTEEIRKAVETAIRKVSSNPSHD